MIYNSSFVQSIHLGIYFRTELVCQQIHCRRFCKPRSRLLDLLCRFLLYQTFAHNQTTRVPILLYNAHVARVLLSEWLQPFLFPFVGPRLRSAMQPKP